MPRLTPKQQSFVDEYLIDLNATAAAERAGYSDGSYGRKLYTKPHVREAIEKAMVARSERTEITQDRVLQELAAIGFANIRDLMVWNQDRVNFVPSEELTPEQTAAISKVKSRSRTENRDDGTSITYVDLELQTVDKLSALAKIMAHLGMGDGPGSSEEDPLIIQVIG